MEQDYKKLIFSMNDEPSQRVYSGMQFLSLLQIIQILDDTEEIISVDNYHHYCNENNFIFGYDWEGGIYRINKNCQMAELIDVFGIIKKINIKENE